METARWRRIEELFHSALEREGSGRPAFVEQACDGDQSLRREVESLLAEAGDTENFLETPALDLAARNLATSREPGTPSHPATRSLGCSAKVAWARSTKLNRKNHAALSRSR